MTPSTDPGRTDDEMREALQRISSACWAALNAADVRNEVGRAVCNLGSGIAQDVDYLLAEDGPLAQLRSDLIAARAERDQLREEWAQEGIGWLRDRDIDRLMSVEDNLIALAKMYGEACGALALTRLDHDALAQWWKMNPSLIQHRIAAAEAEAASLRARLLEAERAVGWQPIESAPKDGKWFLAYNFDSPMCWAPYEFACWSEEQGFFCEEDVSEPTEATHWCPLPAPPALATPVPETKEAGNV